MALVPNYLQLTREKTFSSVAKGTVHIPIALDDNYPAGGYAVDSPLLFNEEGFNFRLLSGYAIDSGGVINPVIHNVATNKLMVVDSHARAEVVGATDLSDFVAYCTFHVW
jgi:hypothetical protein